MLKLCYMNAVFDALMMVSGVPISSCAYRGNCVIVLCCLAIVFPSDSKTENLNYCLTQCG